MNHTDLSSDVFRRNCLTCLFLCVYLLFWVHEKIWKKKELNFDFLSFFSSSLNLVFWTILLELLICRGSYQSSLRFMPIPNQSLPLFCSLLQAGLFFWPRANYIWESRREKSFGQERTKCWQVLLGNLPQEICFLLIGLLAHSGLAQAFHYRRHGWEAFLISDGSEMVGFLYACHMTEVFDSQRAIYRCCIQSDWFPLMLHPSSIWNAWQCLKALGHPDCHPIKQTSGSWQRMIWA